MTHTHTHTHTYTHTHIHTQVVKGRLWHGIITDTCQGHTQVAKVADFGMVTSETHASDACGTPQWMAPEVACLNPKP